MWLTDSINPPSENAMMLKVSEKPSTAVDITIVKAPMSFMTSRTNLIKALVVLNSLRNERSLNQTNIVNKASK